MLGALMGALGGGGAKEEPTPPPAPKGTNGLAPINVINNSHDGFPFGGGGG